MTGHGGSGIVQNDQCHIRFVIDRIDHSGDSRSKKGGISHEGKGFVSGAALRIPWAIVIPAPMQRQVSTISSGMAFPRV